MSPYLHLSLQAGDDMILKRMKRRHSRADAVDLCQRLKTARPDFTFGADIIAGFPTETDAMFKNSLSIISEIGIPWLHVFPFSPREGTPAEKIPPINGTIVKARAKTLRLSLIHISEPTRPLYISYAVFCLKKKNGTSWVPDPSAAK